MKYLFTIMSLLTVLSIGTTATAEDEFIVEYKGALKNMMHKGDISAKANLLELKNKKHLYALGAVENLKGEIQIFDSKPFITSVADSSLIFNNSYDKKATLLVYTTVEKWKEIKVPDTILSYEQLEKYIEKTAKETNVDIDKPFPFLLEGTAKSFDWHVIDWKDGDTVHNHQKHIESGLNGSLKDVPVKMLGFYSKSHHAIFTHHTTNMHIHVKTNDNKIAGHVDGLTLGKGMILKVPDVE